MRGRRSVDLGEGALVLLEAFGREVVLGLLDVVRAVVDAAGGYVQHGPVVVADRVPDAGLDEQGQVTTVTQGDGTAEFDLLAVAGLVPKVDRGAPSHDDHDLGLGAGLVRMRPALLHVDHGVEAREVLEEAQFGRQGRRLEDGVVDVDGQVEESGSAAEEGLKDSGLRGPLLGHRAPLLILPDAVMASKYVK